MFVRPQIKEPVAFSWVDRVGDRKREAHKRPPLNARAVSPPSGGRPCPTGSSGRPAGPTLRFPPRQLSP
jgi:hypothetical protein